jgi:hypothetical protein
MRRSLPGPGMRRSVALYWSPKACLGGGGTTQQRQTIATAAQKTHQRLAVHYIGRRMSVALYWPPKACLGVCGGGRGEGAGGKHSRGRHLELQWHRQHARECCIWKCLQCAGLWPCTGLQRRACVCGGGGEGAKTQQRKTITKAQSTHCIVW